MTEMIYCKICCLDIYAISARYVQQVGTQHNMSAMQCNSNQAGASTCIGGDKSFCKSIK